MNLKDLFNQLQTQTDPLRFRHFISVKKLTGVMVPTEHEDSSGRALSINVELMRLGYIMSEELFAAVKSLGEQSAAELYETLVPTLRYIVGADVKYQPMYPNFPQQVIDASHEELYLNAITHYWTYGAWLPEYEELPRPVSFEPRQFTVLDRVNEEEFGDVFRLILSSKESISDEDKKMVHWFIRHWQSLSVPEEIPYSENLCFVAGMMLNTGLDVAPLVKTTTDVLRVATYLSGGDISLAENTKFRSLPRRQRRQLIGLLEGVAREEDMERHRNKWVRLLHSLHVGDYSPKLYEMAQPFRNNQPIRTYNGRVEQSLKSADASQAVALLEKRPSEFARRLDVLVRKFADQDQTVDRFLATAPDVPTRIHLQLLGHFRRRTMPLPYRIVFPKGATQRAVIVPGALAPLDEGLVSHIRDGIESVLVERFREGDELGKVWIDERLKLCPIPTQQRSASSGRFTVARGTRLDFTCSKTLRFFVYWVGQDIDLSATLHDADFNKIGHISYTNLRSLRFKAAHSGDITSAPNGASEFIDINVDEAVKSGARYVAMNVFVYSGPTFGEHVKCYAGWMERDKPNSNAIYEPETVVQKIDLTANSRNAIPVIFDLVNRQAIWTDVCTRRNIAWRQMSLSTWLVKLRSLSTEVFAGGNNVETNRAAIEETLRAVVTADNKVSLYELFTMHAKARGELTENREEANTIFSWDEGVTPYNISRINAEFLM